MRMSYSIMVEGSADGPWRGNRPQSIEELLKIPNKNIGKLQYLIISKQIEMLLQKGDTDGAERALNAYKTREEEAHPCPLLLFQRDNQNGGCPYVGAHMVFGAIRDSAKFLYPDAFYGGYDDDSDEAVEEAPKKKGKGKKPSKAHLRKFVSVRPHHIFLYRDGNKIEKCDGIEGQQPVGDVKGFARYEVVYPPFTFQFRVSVQDKGPFLSLLTKPKIKEIIGQAVNHGLCGCRGVGYGMWNVTSMKEL
jgi:hypothetical protein